MKVWAWIVEREPALSAGLLAALVVLGDQLQANGLTWRVAYAALPVMLSAAVRSVVTSKRTVAKIVRNQ